MKHGPCASLVLGCVGQMGYYFSSYDIYDTKAYIG
jgi:hypothetical protein